MIEIPLTQNQVAKVDDSDYEAVKHFKWFAHFDGYNFYAHARINGIHVPMHRFLIGAKKGQVVDHINHNGVDNQRKNLRLCRHIENMRNLNMRKSNKSGYKGVSWKSKNKKWCAQIGVGKVIHIGLFENKIDAAKAYDREALRCFGRFALTNKKLGFL